MKLTKYLMSLTLAAAGVATFTSCEDMLDKGNSYVIYADTDHLTSSSDTVTSVVGILNKLQAIAVRTNLIGEVRADLVDVTENGTIDLKNLASFNADVTSKDDENQYNSPRDYYAIINNCNYFLDRVNDSLPEIHTDAMQYMFEREIAQVRTIRAWTYLQCVLAYGKVPFVTKPVLTDAESKAEYPMYGISEICDYFIKDLFRDIYTEMPDYNSFDNSNVTVQRCFFPTSLVMADLYLWKAAIEHDPTSAKVAAKYYYNFLNTPLGHKTRLTTGTNSVEWSTRDLVDSEEPLERASGSFTFATSGNWSSKSNTQYLEPITAIAMDSSSATGFFNELRTLYNYATNPELKEACIIPSEAYKNLSRSQVYVGYDREHNDTIEVSASDIDDFALNKFMDGDLRFSSFWSTTDREYNDKELKLQSISKHRNMNVLVYRTQQVYLRLAEALNYAGYPRFAKQILTIGLSNTVIKNEVQPYYTSSEDSTFINYFTFNDSFYKTYAPSYTVTKDQYGITTMIKPSLVTEDAMSEANMLGIHSRGSGWSFMNKKYLPVLPVDSNYATYPEAELNAIGDAPVMKDYTDQFPKKPTLSTKKIDEPSSWAQYGTQVLTFEEYWAQDVMKSQKESRAQTLYDRYIKNDSIGLYVAYLAAVDAYNAEMEVYSADTAKIMTEYREVLSGYNSRVKTYVDAWNEWHGQIYANPAYIQAEQEQVDQAILDEQALELSYEGNRYYDLMRRAFWYNDPKRLSDPISAARPEVGSKLLDKRNWFLHYKGQIGY